MSDQNPAPEATNPETAPAQEAPTLEALQEQLAAVNAKYERAQKDITKYRTRADEVEQAKRAIEEETLKQKTLEEQLEAYKRQATEATERLTAAEQARAMAELRAAFSGKVVDVDAALKLYDPEKHAKDDAPDVDAFVKQYAFMRLDQKPSAAAAEGEPSTSTRSLRADDFRGKDPEWVMKNLHRLKK
jgi:predicted RNase H-like nuclease (RuvC/YqgF family)